MAVFECDGTMNSGISDEILELCKFGEGSLNTATECHKECKKDWEPWCLHWTGGSYHGNSPANLSPQEIDTLTQEWRACKDSVNRDTWHKDCLDKYGIRAEMYIMTTDGRRIKP